MYIDADVIIKGAALIGAIVTIGGFLFAIFKWFTKQEKPHKEIEELRHTHESDIEALKEELCVLNFATLATLDGLKQLGCNGEVTKAYNDLAKHINKQAHDQL